MRGSGSSLSAIHVSGPRLRALSSAKDAVADRPVRAPSEPFFSCVGGGSAAQTVANALRIPPRWLVA